MVDVVDDCDGSFSRTANGSVKLGRRSFDVRIAFFGVDQVRYLEIESKVRFEVLRIHRIF